jgi:PAS domain S-box-containing protein
MNPPRILHLEDDPLDAALIRGRLDAGGYGDNVDVVPGEAGFRHALATGNYQLILADYRLPGFDGLTALAIALAIWPETPFIFVSGEMGEELAIASLKAGAVDYVLKDNLNRLLPSVENALAKVRDTTARKQAEASLLRQEQKFRSLTENSPDMIARYDRDCRLLYLNQRFAAFLGVADTALLGVTMVEAYADGRFAACQEKMVEAMNTRQRTEVEVCYGDGRVHLFRLAPEFDEQGQVCGALAFASDITAIKQIQGILKGQTEALASTNSALKVMLNHSRQAEAALHEKILLNIDGLIFPYLDQLDRLALTDDAQSCLRQIRHNIKNLATSFAKDLSAPILGLTPREVQIADLIRKGQSSKEIASLLRLSKGTVECYRDQIRKKMDVKNKKINLRSYLLSYFSE